LTGSRLLLSPKRAAKILECAKRLPRPIGAKDASIFDAHLCGRRIITLIDEVLRTLHATWKWSLCSSEVAKSLCPHLSEIDDPYLRERAFDIPDVTKRIIRNRSGVPAGLVGYEETNSSAHNSDRLMPLL